MSMAGRKMGEPMTGRMSVSVNGSSNPRTRRVPMPTQPVPRRRMLDVRHAKPTGIVTMTTQRFPGRPAR